MNRTALAGLFLAICPALAFAQQDCPSAGNLAPDPSALLFTPEQEMDLGDIMAEHTQHKFRVIDDEEVTSYLTRVGTRIARRFPNSGLQFRFYLYDQPELQAFGMPGGRIFVSRKLAAFLRSEDELAGLLSHELSHLVARQPAVDFSRIFRKFFGEQKVGDRRGIFEKYNEIIETARTKKLKVHSHGESEKEQLVADQAGLLAAAQAGYSPQSFVDFFDRFAETKGKTGNWFSDLFGATPPASRRLREMIKQVSNLPPGCRDAPRNSAGNEEFQKWQGAVLRYSGIGHKENIQGVLSRKPLTEPLRPDIEHLRFSPDGKYLLAQDSGGISVLTRDPLAPLFSIDAPKARFAQFTFDSRQIVFLTSDLRVEIWDVGQRQLSSLNEVFIRNGCNESALSPDGRVLACADEAWNVTLYDTSTSESLYRKANFYRPLYLSFFLVLLKYFDLLQGLEFLRMQFSPDSHYFAASSPNGDVFAYDLAEQKEIKVSGDVRRHLSTDFTFLGPDKIAGQDTHDRTKGAIVQFPEGRLTDRFPFGPGRVTASANPRYLLVRPLQNSAVGIFDLKEKKLILSNRMAAFDIWGNTAVSERLSGEIGLYEIPKHEPYKILKMPLGHLSRLRSSAISEDLRWLALSSGTRGAVWDLSGKRRPLLLRGFQGAYFAGDNALYADFPQFEQTERQVLAVTLETDPAAFRRLSKEKPEEGERRAAPVFGMSEDSAEKFYGPVFLRSTRLDKSEWNRNVRVDAVEAGSEKTLWTRTFAKEGPKILGRMETGRIALLWPANFAGAREEMARSPRLAGLSAGAKPREGDSFIEVLDSKSGEVLGGTIIYTGRYSFHLEAAYSTGPYLIVEDSENRVLLFSLETGKELGKVFGSQPIVSPAGNLLCVSGERGELTLYDLPSMQKRQNLLFLNRTVFEAFSQDGRRLLVLTDDQTAFVFDLAAIPVSGTGAP